ncbi:tRNA lysidine(34) synthetase TilS [[Limnothrix rosea] IAM M-220]|uniref:tRNA lysidine(34) synthetase TilS n=1 Tax=[Limnothrix rosea] IAM M-220 TaxID=454133 RepID=UPI001F2AEA8E|nr:tRNA lysidine(34) synthetase TilS [[Limnothrix rosea] IAM M-220]
MVAVSGGQDSLCLGQLLVDLSSRWQWQLAIAHCNHGWSGDAAIADHVRKIAQQWHRPFFSREATTPIKETEAAARQWRYQQLTAMALAKKFNSIATGHTLTDRAETLLFNLVRGSGLQGLGALTEQRCLADHVTLTRPLLTVSRTETAAFCQEFNLPIYEDIYNQNLHFSRNRLRHNVFPELKQINKKTEQHLAQTAAICQEENEYLEAIASDKLSQYLNKDQSLQRLPLRQLHPALQRRILWQYLALILSKTPTFQQVEESRQLIQAPNHSQTSSFFRAIRLAVQNELIIPIASNLQ